MYKCISNNLLISRKLWGYWCVSNSLPLWINAFSSWASPPLLQGLLDPTLWARNLMCPTILFLNDFKEEAAGCTDTGNAWCNLLLSEKGPSLIQAIFCPMKKIYLKLENIQRKYGIQYISASHGLCLLVAQIAYLCLTRYFLSWTGHFPMLIRTWALKWGICGWEIYKALKGCWELPRSKATC